MFIINSEQVDILKLPYSNENLIIRKSEKSTEKALTKQLSGCLYGC